MTIGLYKYYHLVHNFFSVRFHGNNYWPRVVYTEVSFSLYENDQFSKESMFKHIEKLEMVIFCCK